MYLHTRKESMLHPLIPGSGRLWRARLLALAGMLALALTHAAPAHAAGTYIHKGCVTGADLADAYGGWQANGYPVNGIANSNLCAWGGLHSELNPTAAVPLGTTVGWTYTAPSHTSISRFLGEYAGWTKIYDVNRGILQFLDGDHHV